MKRQPHIMLAGSIAFIPGWILLFITILSLAMLSPNLFQGGDIHKPFQQVISPLLLVFMIGSLMPAFDDLFAFVFGPPFAHHSLFHSFLGCFITFGFFFLTSGAEIAKFALFGNLYHIAFNFILDYVTIFFPLTYREFGLTDLIGKTTYQIKIILYPVILIIFGFAILVSFIIP